MELKKKKELAKEPPVLTDDQVLEVSTRIIRAICHSCRNKASRDRLSGEMYELYSYHNVLDVLFPADPTKKIYENDDYVLVFRRDADLSAAYALHATARGVS